MQGHRRTPTATTLSRQQKTTRDTDEGVHRGEWQTRARLFSSADKGARCNGASHPHAYARRAPTLGGGGLESFPRGTAWLAGEPTLTTGSEGVEVGKGVARSVGTPPLPRSLEGVGSVCTAG